MANEPMQSGSMSKSGQEMPHDEIPKKVHLQKQQLLIVTGQIKWSQWGLFMLYLLPIPVGSDVRCGR